MVHNPLLVAALSAGLLAPLASGMYTKNSPVLQLDSKNFESKILNSGHESIVEFYAPWCGHCKNLKPAYEKAAENLKGLANVAAIDCDDDRNKRTCSEYGIQGFPTLKAFRPNKNGKPQVMDYQGPRTAKGIVDFVLDQIPNYVARVSSKTVENFLAKNNETTKAILFTTKGVATPLYKALAIDFRGAIEFAQIRDKETDAVSIFGVQKYPTLLVLPGGDKDGVLYDGEMKKEAMFKFLSGFQKPTEGKASAPVKEDKKKKTPKKDGKQEPIADEEAPAADTPVAPPKPTWDATISVLDGASLETLASKKGICILVFTLSEGQPLQPFEDTNYYLNHVKHSFPFYQVPASLLSPPIKAALKLENSDVPQMRAVSFKRGWWIGYNGDATSAEDMKTWVDAVKLGELKKNKLPEEPPKAEDPEELVQEIVVEPPVKEEEPAKEVPKHEEL